MVGSEEIARVSRRSPNSQLADAICRALVLVPSALILVFIGTGPWFVASLSIERLSLVLGVAAAVWILALPWRGWRGFVWRWVALARPEVGLKLLTVVFCLAAFLFGRFVIANYQGLRINAWDFSVFDLALAGGPQPISLYDPVQHTPLLGLHGYFTLYALLPLYRLVESPYWLLLIHATALAAAAAAAVLVAKEICDDGFTAVYLAGAFTLNSFTAKIAGYPFHPEVFYPLALFTLLLGFFRRRPVVFGLGIALAVLTKEDAVLPLLGFSAAALLLRRLRPAVTALILGSLGFFVSVFLVMPRFSGSLPGHPWYAEHWTAYGATPLSAVWGMATHLDKVIAALARSGVPSLLETFCFVPLLGAEWLLASIPSLVVYGASGGGSGGVAQFSLYYSAPVLPALFAATAQGLNVLSRWSPRRRRLQGAIRQRHRLRLGALVVLAVAGLDGASFRFAPRSPRAEEIRPTLSHLDNSVRIKIQGALLPHAGYDSRLAVLDSLAVLRSEAVLLDLIAPPYPFTQETLARLAAELQSDPERTMEKSKNGLLLFHPVEAPVVSGVRAFRAASCIRGAAER